MKWIILPFIILFMCVNIYASPTVKLGSTIDETSLGEIEELAEEKYDINLKQLIKDISEGNMKVTDLFDNVYTLLCAELKKNSAAVKGILLICILNGIIAATVDGFVKNGMDKTAYFAAYTAIVSMLTAGFKVCGDMLEAGAENIAEIMRAGIPIMLCIITADSGAATAAGFAGILSVAVSALDILIKNLVLPQIIFSVMLGILNCLWDRTMVGKLAELFAFVASWEIRLTAFLFVGCLSVSRLGISPASQALGKGVRLAVGAVPVVGGLFENSLEAVVSCVGILKGGVAAAVIIIIVIGAAAQLIKLCGVMLMYKLTAALSEPMGNKKITEMIDCVGEGVRLIIASYFTIMVMFIAAVGVMLGSLS